MYFDDLCAKVSQQSGGIRPGQQPGKIEHTYAVQSFIYVSIIRNIGTISNNIFSEIKTERLDSINKQLIEMKNKKKEVSENLEEFKNTDIDEEIKTVINDLNKYYIDEFNSKIKELNRQKFELENKGSIPQENNVSLRWIISTILSRICEAFATP